MPLTLLLDLDDTLLDTNLDSFMPIYFQALSNHMADRVSSEKLICALINGMNAMNENEDPRLTLQEVFDSEFYTRIGIRKDELLDVVEDFYDNIFPALRKHTRQKPEAVPLIEWALSCGFRVAIATDPLFPYKAAHHRLRWAGLEPEQFELISTTENFHFTKSHPAHYAGALGRLGWPDGPVLIVGNDASRDLIPAHRLGLKTYFIETESASSPGPSPALPGTVRLKPYQGRCAPGVSVDAAQDRFEAGRGTLADLRPWLESVDLSTLEPSYKSREAILGIMASTPAVLQGMFTPLTQENWNHEPAPDDWALNEIVCHLRDTELEVHAVQLDLLLGKADAFIPRPDTAVWANERDYLHEDGATAIADFTNARVDILNKLMNHPEDIWLRRARHAIFGPTDFMEIMNFIADHDRMHLQQAWKTLQSVGLARRIE